MTYNLRFVEEKKLAGFKKTENNFVKTLLTFFPNIGVERWSQNKQRNSKNGRIVRSLLPNFSTHTEIPSPCLGNLASNLCHLSKGVFLRRRAGHVGVWH